MCRRIQGHKTRLHHVLHADDHLGADYHLDVQVSIISRLKLAALMDCSNLVSHSASVRNRPIVIHLDLQLV